MENNTTKQYRGNSNRTRGPRKDGEKRGGKGFFERPKPEFDQKMISIRRVTRVVAGGRRMTFAVAMAIGDKKGKIGIGTGKGGDTAIAIAKALRQARKSMFKVKTTKDFSIPHEVSVKYSSARLTLMPNGSRGIVAGSTVRDILILGGFKNITAKIHSGSKNKLNNAMAAYEALYEFKEKNSSNIDSISENESTSDQENKNSGSNDNQ